MANTLLNISMITQEALRVLVNNLGFTKNATRQYDSMFGVEGAKIGTTANVRKPVRYLGGEGPALTIEDITETSVPVVLNHQSHVGISFTSQDLKLRIDEFSKRLIQPAVANIANKIDMYGLQLYQKVYNYAGTPGVVPAGLTTYLAAQTALNNNACPMDGQRVVCITPNMEGVLVDALKALFQSSTQIKEQYEKGVMGIAAGFTFKMDQNCAAHVVGALGTSAPLIDGAGQTGTSILLKGMNASITNVFNVGDIVQFAGVYQVNPQNRNSTGVLQPFTITAPASSTGGGAVTISISPSIITSGAYQTVTTTAADSAVVTVFGIAAASFAGLTGSTIAMGLAYHPDAFTLACADLPLPEGVDKAARAADSDLGISLRMIRQYDIMSDRWPCRVDVLYGWAALREELACRILGS